jgi:hypothetical protein
MPPNLLKVFFLCLLSLFTSEAFAHKPSDSYLNFKVEENVLSGQWDISLRDLEFAVGLDADGDGQITWKEVKNKQVEIVSYAFARLQIFSGEKLCPIQHQSLLIDHHSDGAYAVLTFKSDCVVQQDLDVKYSLFFDFDTQHKGLVRVQNGSAITSGIFAAQENRISFNLVHQSFFKQFFNYVEEGIWHIWSGFDHVLFLLSLLLPAVFFIEGNRYKPVASFKPTFVHTLSIVTCFTIAHSITLSLAALQIVVLPSRLVESTIAFSVIFAAFNNLWPIVKSRIWLVAFLFGLIHGFGFASVLMDLGLKENNLLSCLLGFNLGVEVGQFVIVLIVLPVIFFLRNTRFYRQFFFQLLSSLICFVAFIWLAERMFDLKIITLR